MYLEDEVGIKIGLEVSNVSNTTTTASGTTTYQLGTRNAATTLRLKNGETQVLAGLISDEDRRAAAQVPGLAGLPVVGRLFSNHNDNVTRTEIVLLITPRVVRNIDRPSPRLEEFNSGTENISVGSGADASVSTPTIVPPQPPVVPQPPAGMQPIQPSQPQPGGGSGYPPAAGPAPTPRQQ